MSGIFGNSFVKVIDCDTGCLKNQMVTQGFLPSWALGAHTIMCPGLKEGFHLSVLMTFEMSFYSTCYQRHIVNNGRHS